MSSVSQKLSDALTQLAKVKVNDKTSSSALATAKTDVRDARAELEAVSSPPPPAPTPDLRPWITPIGTLKEVGEPGKSTVLPGGIYEDILFRGQIVRESGEAVIRRCRFVGPHGLGEGGTLLYLKGGTTFTEDIEVTGSEGRSGVYQHGGIWIPIDIWVHDNGVGQGAMFQQVYIGAGEVKGGEGGLIERGVDYGLQAYNSPGGTDQVTGIDWGGLEIRGCPHGGIVLSHRVFNAKLRKFNVHGNGIGVYGYNLEGTGNEISDSNVWGNQQNFSGAGIGRTNIAETAPVA